MVAPTSLAALITLLLVARSQSQLSCSEYDSRRERYRFPDFGLDNTSDVAANTSLFEDSEPNKTNIYSIPVLPSGCSNGSVTGIRYCYTFRPRSSPASFLLVFSLSIFRVSGALLNVVDVVNISSMPNRNNGMCVSPASDGTYYCCDFFELDPWQEFDLPSADTAFGITSIDTEVSLLRWRSMFQVEQVKISASSYFKIRDEITLQQRPMLSDDVKLLHFEIRRIYDLPPWMCVKYNDEERFYFPSFPVGSKINVALNNLSYISEPNTTYIYSNLSGIGCGGVVTHVDFCYSGAASSTRPFFLGNEWPLFSLLVLTELDNVYTVANIINISTRATNRKCIRPWRTVNYCCDNYSLTEELEIPLPNTSYGINVLDSRAELLGWHSSFSVDHYKIARSTSYTLGEMIVLNNSRINEPLEIVRFRIRPYVYSSSATPTLPPNTPPPLSSLLRTQLDTSTAQLPTPTPFSLPTRSTSALLPVISITSLPFNSFVSPTSSTVASSLVFTRAQPSNIRSRVTVSMTAIVLSNSITPSTMESLDKNISFLSTSAGLGVVVGVAVGAVFFLCVLSIVVAVAVMTVKKKKGRLDIGDSKDAGNCFNNAIYIDGNTEEDQQNAVNNLGNTYAKVGPRTRKSVSNNDVIEPAEEQYDYVRENSPATSSHYDTLNRNKLRYVAPPSNLDELYAHLDSSRSDTVSRATVKLNEMLGSGQFGEVFHGVWHCKSGDVAVAVKSLKEDCDDQERVKFLQEAAIMSQFRHLNVVTMHGSIAVGEPALIVLELLEKGDLRKYLLSMRAESGALNPELQDKDLLGYCHHIASGMNYLSSKGFVHRDLAARNILVSQERICKIADFGMSRDLMDETYYLSKGGAIPVKWTAPEALHYKKYSSASDVWSYGIVMFEIWSIGHKPFEGVTNNKVLKLIESGYRLPPPPGCPRAIYSLMISCWNSSTDQRPSFSYIESQLSRHDFQMNFLDEEQSGMESDAFKLGVDLPCSINLYKDLQVKYSSKSSNNTTAEGTSDYDYSCDYD